MLTYSGRIESGDTYTLFDVTDSLAQYGDRLLDRSAWYNQPDPLSQVPGLPLTSADVEPLQPLLAAPLYAVASLLPGVGQVHAVWLFNVLISSATAALLYAYVILRGGDQRSALLTSILLATCTIMWPYSKTFFREPLAAFLLLSSGYFLERWRLGRLLFSWNLLFALLSIVAALLTKDAILLALPALIWVALPLPSGAITAREAMRRVTAAVLLACTVLLIVLFVILITVPPSQLERSMRGIAELLGLDAASVRFWPIALQSYLFSAGGSIWGTSPIVLLALVGTVVLYRRGSFRYALLVPALVLPFAMGYAVLRGVHWFGGLSWPPRFMVPLIPFLMLVAAPAIEKILNARRRRWFALCLAGLIVYSGFIQITAVSYSWGAYASSLPAESGGLIEWLAGMNQAEYFRWMILPTLWGRVPLDFAWVRVSVPLWPIACLLLMALGLAALYRRGHARFDRMLLPGLILGTIAAPWLLLMTLRGDALYLGDNPSLSGLSRLLSDHVPAGDTVLLADDNYLPYVLNAVSQREPRIIVLPDPPGEQPSPEQPPRIRASNPASLLEKETVVLIQKLAQLKPRIWLLADTGPWIPWSMRPVERFLSAQNYPLAEYSSDPPDPRLRLIEFDTTLAPDQFAYRSADFTTDFRFGSSIALVGFSLPAGSEYEPGAVIPITFLWQSEHKLEQNYTIALFVVPEVEEVPVAQGFDSQPAWGFAPTTTWLPGVAVWDNRAVGLSPDLPPGTYRLWLRMYQSDDSSVVLPVSGTATRPDGIAVLPVLISVR